MDCEVIFDFYDTQHVRTAKMRTGNFVRSYSMRTRTRTCQNIRFAGGTQNTNIGVRIVDIDMS